MDVFDIEETWHSKGMYCFKSIMVAEGVILNLKTTNRLHEKASNSMWHLQEKIKVWLTKLVHDAHPHGSLSIEIPTTFR